MEFIKPGINIDFMGKKKIAPLISLVLIAIGIISLLIKGGPNYGIDFVGGTLIQVKFSSEINSGEVKNYLKKIGLEGFLVQQFGEKEENEYLIRVEKSEEGIEGLSGKIKKGLTTILGKENFEIRRVEMVGPQVGKVLRQKGISSIFYAMIGILIYISWRFEFKFAAGAIVALMHDIAITVGVFSLTDKEITLPIIAALLTIVGYSLNDTIVVFDRIRENLRKKRKEEYEKIINMSINETLSRTILTSGTTLLVVVSLLVLGGGVIHDFAFALLVGIIAGTYSSIFIASPVLIFWEKVLPAAKKRIKW